MNLTTFELVPWLLISVFVLIIFATLKCSECKTKITKKNFWKHKHNNYEWGEPICKKKQ